MKFAKKNVTLIFSARKSSINRIGKNILDVLNIMRIVWERDFKLPINPKFKKLRDECISLAIETMGKDNLIIPFLKENFVIHDADIPRSLRVKLERLVRYGGIRLIIATSTLGQGVNLPIHTIIIDNVSYDQESKVSPMEFWNICGRAGRGMRDNEGQVLFFVQRTFKEWKKTKSEKFKNCTDNFQLRKWEEWKLEETNYRQNLITSYNQYHIQSSLLQLFRVFLELWEQKFHDKFSFSEFCDYLANQSNLNIQSPNNMNIFEILDYLDSLILALKEERDITSVTLDQIQLLLQNSLIYMQIEKDEDRNKLNQFLISRITYIDKKYPDSNFVSL